MTHALHRRLLRLEQAAGASDADKVVGRPAGLEGEALAEWERNNLADQGDYGLVVVLNKFAEPDAAPGCGRVLCRSRPRRSCPSCCWGSMELRMRAIYRSSGGIDRCP